MAKGERELSSRAEQLRARLTQGDGRHIAVPSVYPGRNALGNHARAYFSTAVHLCEEPRNHDFLVFGVLYCIRHGLELWLKEWIQDAMLDRASELIFSSDAPSVSFSAVCEALELNKKNERRALRESLCGLRNVLERKMSAPECYEANVSDDAADEAISFFRSSSTMERMLFEPTWRVVKSIHDLSTLWQQAEPLVERLSPRVDERPEDIGEVLEPADIGATCELFHLWDPIGDAFRYPLSTKGEWQRLDSVNLKELGQLACKLDQTVLLYCGLPGRYRGRFRLPKG